LVDVEEHLRQNEKLSALGLLAAEAAHEIRNPLTVLKMLYHSLDLKFPEGDPRAKDARIIDEKIGQLNRIVEQILDLARSAEPELASVNLNELIEELGLLVRHKLKHQNIQWVQQFAPDLPPVMGAATQLDQAFLNLILNAVEAMPGGGVLTITSRSVRLPRGSAQPTHVVIKFRDTGQGMSEEQRRRAFTSLLSTAKAKGTGLGLAIVARVVEAHRGKITIRSRLGLGTTVSVILPL
jgi:signal transduction histidine kinase